MADAPIDEDALLDLVDDDPEFLETLIQTFIEDCAEYLSAIRTAVDEDDADALTREAHGLKGAVANMQAESAREVARELEDCGQTEDLARAAEVLPRLEKEIDRLRRALQSLIE